MPRHLLAAAAAAAHGDADSPPAVGAPVAALGLAGSLGSPGHDFLPAVPRRLLQAPALTGSGLAAGRGFSASNGSSFLCMQEERPCPEVNFSRAAWYNARLGPKCSYKSHQDCCHAISRSQKAYARAEALVDGNWYLRYCAAGPLDVEPLVALAVRWWQRRRDTPEPPEGDGAAEPGPPEVVPSGRPPA